MQKHPGRKTFVNNHKIIYKTNTAHFVMPSNAVHHTDVNLLEFFRYYCDDLLMFYIVLWIVSIHKCNVHGI